MVEKKAYCFLRVEGEEVFGLAVLFAKSFLLLCFRCKGRDGKCELDFVQYMELTFSFQMASKILASFA